VGGARREGANARLSQARRSAASQLLLQLMGGVLG